MWRRKAKLEAQLNIDLEKPKGMHWDKYNRIIEKWNDAENKLDYATVRHIGQLMGVA